MTLYADVNGRQFPVTRGQDVGKYQVCFILFVIAVLVSWNKNIACRKHENVLTVNNHRLYLKVLLENILNTVYFMYIGGFGVHWSVWLKIHTEGYNVGTEMYFILMWYIISQCSKRSAVLASKCFQKDGRCASNLFSNTVLMFTKAFWLAEVHVSLL